MSLRAGTFAFLNSGDRKKIGSKHLHRGVDRRMMQKREEKESKDENEKAFLVPFTFMECS